MDWDAYPYGVAPALASAAAGGAWGVGEMGGGGREEKRSGRRRRLPGMADRDREEMSGGVGVRVGGYWRRGEGGHGEGSSVCAYFFFPPQPAIAIGDWLQAASEGDSTRAVHVLSFKWTVRISLILVSFNIPTILFVFQYHATNIVYHYCK